MTCGQNNLTGCAKPGWSDPILSVCSNIVVAVHDESQRNLDTNVVGRRGVTEQILWHSLVTTGGSSTFWTTLWTPHLILPAQGFRPGAQNIKFSLD